MMRWTVGCFTVTHDTDEVDEMQEWLNELCPGDSPNDIRIITVPTREHRGGPSHGSMTHISHAIVVFVRTE